MSSHNDVFLVSAGMIKPKKLDHLLARNNLYPNYSLIGLATILENAGHSPIIFHGDFSEPQSICDLLVEYQFEQSKYPLLLSIPSCFALPWAKSFCLLVKQTFPLSKLIVGGKWVVGTDGGWMKRQIPQADLIVYGNAEQRIRRLLEPERWDTLNFTNIAKFQFAEPILHDAPYLNYGLVYDFKKYQPSVEVSRGCGIGCSFCLDKDIPLSEMQSTNKIVKHLQRHHLMYKSEDISPYFQASYFRPTPAWAIDFKKQYRLANLSTPWRAQTRVDGLIPKTLSTLAEAGLRIIDLGLESASISQITRMKKSPRPEIYLKRASELLQECKRSGVWAKVNILLYAGETLDTINETCSWLDKHKSCIKGVSVNPLFVYRFDASSHEYLNSLREFGAAPVHESSLDDLGYARMHLSKQLTFDAVEKIAIDIRRLMMSERDYFDLKSFSYFPRGFTYSMFSELVHKSDSAYLPFHTNHEVI